MKLIKLKSGHFLIPALVIACLFTANCRVAGQRPRTIPCPAIPTESPAPPATPACLNEALTSYDGLLLIVPHPDDEVLGFAGLMSEFIRLGKPVSIVIVTDGDGYCDACAFWKNIGTTTTMSEWAPCDEADLARFAEIRRGESAGAQKVLGGPAPVFWNYPDTGINAAWEALTSGKDVDVPLRRSDCSLEGVFGKGSALTATPQTLYNQIVDLIGRSSPGTLVGTTHPLDGHGDHRGLGSLVRKVNAGFAADDDPATAPRSVAFAVIHANTYRDGCHYDYWYPYPDAVDCQCLEPARMACYLADTSLLERMRNFRYRPEWSWRLPEDAPYLASIPGSREIAFCLSPALFRGEAAAKLLAVRKFVSQQGLLAENGTIPAGLAGFVDCAGYQLAFIKANEVFVLETNK
ncbi:MAG TPA: PIG-L family deacetylase [Acidobacteriota bacterium]